MGFTRTLALAAWSCWVGLGCASSLAARALPPAAGEDLQLLSPDGTPVPLQALLSRQQATVFVFWSPACPCVRRYQARIEALAEAWSARDVAFVQVASNAGDTLEGLRAAERERRLALPVWRDEGGALARRLGARSTPTVALVSRDGALLYRGWVDNERLPGTPGREAWLEAALEGFSSGAPFPHRSPTWGCAITRSLSNAIPRCHVPPAAANAAAGPSGEPP